MIEKTGGRPPGVVQAEPSPQAPNAALLVDFDNVTMGIRSDLQNQLRKLLNSAIIRGKVSVQRAYADWRRYPQYIVPLTEASIDLIFAPAVGANKKNATDIRLAIDALELVFTRPEIGTYILLSGDSDFSALVLKLKEYGKFVIGVGIRESSSDLLVQNCDEYYSYNELTGLARTGEVEVVRRDPWELVVEAVQKMSQSGDVMRSDRLKQVMQSIDPNFDEKDVGCNRFSKFVLEAGQRGLVRLTKMENGQYAVDVGPNANVSVDRQPSVEAPSVATSDSPTSPRRKRTTRSRSDREGKSRTLTLAESLDLLKRALKAVGALGEESTQADTARARMIEIHGNEADPIFEPKRFQRMLRQAHDANVIELIKSDGDDYMLKLSVAAVAGMESVDSAAVQDEAGLAVAGGTGEEGGEEEKSDEPKKTVKRKTTKKTTKKTAKKTTKKKSTRSRTRTAAKDSGEDTMEEVAASAAGAEAGEAVEQEPKEKATRRKTTKKKTTSRKKVELEKEAKEVEGAGVAGEKPKTSTPIVNPRFRKGSRSAAPKPPAKDGPNASEKASGSEPVTPTLKVSDGPRHLGMRSGSRGAKRLQAPAPKVEDTEDHEKPKPAEPEIGEPKAAGASPTHSGSSKESVPPAQSELPKDPATSEKSEPKPEKQKEAAAVEPAAEPDDDGAGLFKRVTAAFQRAMGTPKGQGE